MEILVSRSRGQVTSFWSNHPPLSAASQLYFIIWRASQDLFWSVSSYIMDIRYFKCLYMLFSVSKGFFSLQFRFSRLFPHLFRWVLVVILSWLYCNLFWSVLGHFWHIGMAYNFAFWGFVGFFWIWWADWFYMDLQKVVFGVIYLNYFYLSFNFAILGVFPHLFRWVLVMILSWLYSNMFWADLGDFCS